MNKTNIFIATSTLALLGLLLFQISWYKHTQGLLKEQFDATVNMAMSLAIQNVDANNLSNRTAETTLANVGPDNVFKGIIDDNIDLKALDAALGKALNFYNIDLDYEFHILDQNQINQCGTGYCCVLSPFVKTNTQSLQVYFPDKVPYLRAKMKFQLGACLLIILFISSVFLLANYLLRQQRRIAQNNVDFFNNMAHEFNTPLTNIGLATKMISKSGDIPKSTRFINIIENESVKLKQQVERFLQLTQMENGCLGLQLTQINLLELLQDVVADMQLQMVENNGSLNFHAENEAVFVEADKFHLANAFRNLIDNAIKYADKAPVINVYLKKDKDTISVLFEDAGIGIPLIEQKHIFNKFHRVHTGDMHQQKGFGLGLAYVKMIVEAHKGVIEVFSEMNKGSRFDLQLPLKSIS